MMLKRYLRPSPSTHFLLKQAAKYLPLFLLKKNISTELHSQKINEGKEGA